MVEVKNRFQIGRRLSMTGERPTIKGRNVAIYRTINDFNTVRYFKAQNNQFHY